MNRYTLRQDGMLLGTYAGDTDAEAFDAWARENHAPNGQPFTSFAELCNVHGVTRDNFKAQLVKE